ncbi:MAG: hypothetical protein H6779_04090 [Candidatus Nomurabacteria bacterium]|nr:MAG: hypothetical protein H6779_04090 [Candidatus Nomurabacteria bacterium]
MDSTLNTTTTATTNTGGVPLEPVTFDVVSAVVGLITGTSYTGVTDFFGGLWNAFVIISYTLSIIMLLIYVYAATQYRQLSNLRLEMMHKRERLYDEQFRSGPRNSRLEDIDKHITSDNPNDWKLAIIEADIVLDDELKKVGYTGTSLGERLRSINTAQLNSLDDAWQAHKVRNQIAHGGADFVLTKHLAENTIKQYKRVFGELGIR